MDRFGLFVPGTELGREKERGTMALTSYLRRLARHALGRTLDWQTFVLQVVTATDTGHLSEN